MTIATKSGKVILKDGLAAKSCSCCFNCRSLDDVYINSVSVVTVGYVVSAPEVIPSGFLPRPTLTAGQELSSSDYSDLFLRRLGVARYNEFTVGGHFLPIGNFSLSPLSSSGSEIILERYDASYFNGSRSFSDDFGSTDITFSNSVRLTARVFPPPGDSTTKCLRMTILATSIGTQDITNRYDGKTLVNPQKTESASAYISSANTNIESTADYDFDAPSTAGGSVSVSVGPYYTSFPPPDVLSSNTLSPAPVIHLKTQVNFTVYRNNLP